MIMKPLKRTNCFKLKKAKDLTLVNKTYCSVIKASVTAFRKASRPD